MGLTNACSANATASDVVAGSAPADTPNLNHSTSVTAGTTNFNHLNSVTAGTTSVASSCSTSGINCNVITSGSNPLIAMTEYDSSDLEVKKRYDQQICQHGRITNMKRTLLNSIPAFDIYMEWYRLRDLIAEFIGDDGATYFAYAISSGSNCLICSTFFRKILIDQGKNPDQLSVSNDQQLLLDFGQAIAQDPHHIAEKIYQQLEQKYTAEQLTLLVAFAGQMLATNLFNTVTKVPLDQELYEYRATTTTNTSLTDTDTDTGTATGTGTGIGTAAGTDTATGTGIGAAESIGVTSESDTTVVSDAIV
jgi:hypothetical protein